MMPPAPRTNAVTELVGDNAAMDCLRLGIGKSSSPFSLRPSPGLESLSRRDKHGDQAAPAVQRSERLADHRTEGVLAVSCFHCMS